MKAILRQLLCRTVSPVLRACRRDCVAILMFHGFTDREHQGCENSQHKHLHVCKMDAFLAFLTRHYRITSLDEIVDRLRAGRALPPRAVVLTFDDGFHSNYSLAWPLLQRYQAPAIIYLATEFVNDGKPIWTDRVDYAFNAVGKTSADLKAAKQRLKQLPQEEVEPAVAEMEDSLGARLTRANDPVVPAIYHSLEWEQVREMQAGGLVQFGAHTHTHKILGRSEPETVQHELETSKAIIERETGIPCRHFCYPNGGPGDFSRASEQIVAETGFISSLTTLSGWVTATNDAFLLPRLGIGNDLDLPRFDLMLAGFNALIGKARRGAPGS
jgi:peptidoglycan/xylan/chitin deacetylase (PgdA/CDA1 family)